MPVVTPPEVIEPFGKNAAVGQITNPIPVASQIGITPGAASYNDGFPPQCFVDTSAGGTPPRGADFNGILYTLSAAVAAINAGQLYPYSATLQTAISGYALGAVLAKADGSGFWISTTGANVTDPDTGGAGWASLLKGPNTFAQGDIIYASAANTLSALAKNTTATRYLANTGASNAPAWAQIALATGVTGVLPIANIAAVPAWTSNPQNANYTLVLADAGKQILHANTDATARTYTVPLNTAVAYAIGTEIKIVNDSTSAGSDTITFTAGVTLVLAGTGGATTGNRTLAIGGVASLFKVATNRWMVSGPGVT